VPADASHSFPKVRAKIPRQVAGDVSRENYDLPSGLDACCSENRRTSKTTRVESRSCWAAHDRDERRSRKCGLAGRKTRSSCRHVRPFGLDPAPTSFDLTSMWTCDAGYERSQCPRSTKGCLLCMILFRGVPSQVDVVACRGHAGIASRFCSTDRSESCFEARCRPCSRDRASATATAVENVAICRASYKT